MKKKKLPAGSKAHLRVRMSGGRIQITIGILSLANAVKFHPWLSRFDEATGDYAPPDITDPEALGRAIVNVLEREGEEGETRVHIMFDDAAFKAVEEGAEGIVLAGDKR